MSPRQRIILAIVLSIIALVGTGLVFVSSQDPIVIISNTQKTVCNFEYAVEIDPSQTLKNNCVVLQNDWLYLNVKSTLNLTFSISLAKVGGGQIIVYNNTGSHLNASFPITENGAILSSLSNRLNNVSSVNGSLTVSEASVANTTSLTISHPYRVAGEALLGVGVLGILLVIWNPAAPGVPRNLVVRRSENPPQ